MRATADHLIFNMEVWSALMSSGPSHAASVAAAEVRTIPALLSRLEIAASRFEDLAHAIRERDGWDDTWLDVLDDPPVRKSFGGAIAHVITHSMHHRAQLLYMLRKLGLTDLPEGDVLGWEQQWQSRKGDPGTEPTEPA